jgi:hypothetical protein
MNNKDQEKLLKIRKLLKEAYDHYFEFSEDGHCKSSEGHISVDFGNYWEDKNCELKITGVNIYSYVLGPSRSHYFKDLDNALESVVEWHRLEMEDDYDKDVLEEAAYWNDYFKKHPEEKIEFTNPDYKGPENERSF